MYAASNFLSSMISYADPYYRDLTEANIMMDGGDLFPRPLHPKYSRYTRNAFGRWSTYRPPRRIYVQNHEYLVIDFGHSIQFASLEDRRFVINAIGRDRTVPEQQPERDGSYYDPFPIDIYQLGNTIRQTFINVREDCVSRVCVLSLIVHRCTLDWNSLLRPWIG